MNQRLPGLILAGGRGTRLGGDKPMRLLAGQPLVAHVLARLTPWCDPLWLSANDDCPGLDELGLPRLRDADDSRSGPLAGLLAGLTHLATLGDEAPALLCAPADAPFLPEDLVPRLRTAQKGPDVPVIAASGGRMHPTVGLWPRTAAPRIRQALAEDFRRIGHLATALGAIVVEWPFGKGAGVGADPFFNVNTPEDLATAEARLAGAEVTLDLVGLKCPLPALKTAKRLETLAAATVLRVICTDPMAAIDIPNLAREKGHTLLETLRAEDRLIFRLRRRAE